MAGLLWSFVTFLLLQKKFCEFDWLCSHLKYLVLQLLSSFTAISQFKKQWHRDLRVWPQLPFHNNVQFVETVKDKVDKKFAFQRTLFTFVQHSILFLQCNEINYSLSYWYRWSKKRIQLIIRELSWIGDLGSFRARRTLRRLQFFKRETSGEAFFSLTHLTKINNSMQKNTTYK